MDSQANNMLATSAPHALPGSSRDEFSETKSDVGTNLSNPPFRPGILLGPYPEQVLESEGWLDGIARQMRGFAARRGIFGRHQSAWPRLIHEVDRWEKEFSGISQSAITTRAKWLRQRLRVQGFQMPLVAECFALIREVADQRLGMRHYNSQLIGGWGMTQGMLVEMETGEGKTLTATLPACVAALAGVPVHVVSVNDYLVMRDAEAMKPIYEAFGLKVGVITEELEPDARRQAYRCDITYCSNKQIAFDYLKDRLAFGGRMPGSLRLQVESLSHKQPRTDRLLLRGLCFAIVDEADSVLIDQARTPLIISKPGENDEEQRTYEQALKVAQTLRLGEDYLIETRERRIQLTEGGREHIAQLGASFGGLWRGRRRREELARQALSAVHLFERDRDYLVRDEEVHIIDEFTGRTMPDRSWERGLHQLIEAKEGLEPSARNETLARISYQRFFRRYLRLAGMSGTAREVAPELWSVYDLKVARVSPNRPVQRISTGDKLFAGAEQKWAAIVAEIALQHHAGRPVLVGTRSVGASEHLSKLLDEARLPHRILNALQDEDEAEIVSLAGLAAQITVATNMAGRGTDIRLSDAVREAGGLHVVATERHEAGRIDRQLFGRCGRQGDPGSYSVFMALDDELFEVYNSGITSWVARLLVGLRAGQPIAGLKAQWLAKRVQQVAERRHARVRREVVRVDEQLDQVLAFAGKPE